MNQRALTWTGLLAQWTQAAQASMAIPEEHDGPGLASQHDATDHIASSDLRP